MSESRRQHRRSMRLVHSPCLIFYFSVKNYLSIHHDSLHIVDDFALSSFLLPSCFITF